jgi:hypothetical protein
MPCMAGQQHATPDLEAHRTPREMVSQAAEGGLNQNLEAWESSQPQP